MLSYASCGAVVRLSSSCILRRLASLFGCRRLFGNLGVYPYNEPVGKAYVDDLHVALENGAGPFEIRELSPCACRRIGGQQHVDRIIDTQVPTAVADADGRADTGGKIRLGGQYVEQFCGVVCGVLTDHERQLREPVEVAHRDDGAIVIEQIELAAMLPQSEWFALDKADIERVGKPALDHRRTDPGQPLQLLFGSRRTDAQDGSARRRTKRCEDGVTVGSFAPLDLDVCHDQTQARGAIKDALGSEVQRRLHQQ